MPAGSSSNRVSQLALVALFAGLGAALAVALTTWGMQTFAAHKAASGLAGYPEAQACNVLGIQIHGQVVGSRSYVPVADMQPLQNPDGSATLIAQNYTIADEADDLLRNASRDESIKAILLDIDSGGGSVVSGDELSASIRKVGKPSVVVVHDVAASTAYLIASAADRIFASQDSAIGSIGETASFITQVEKNKKDGLKYEILSSGPFKDMYSPDKPITDDERKLIMRDIQIGHNNFVELVALYRHQPVEAIEKLADGSTMLGRAALASGLIDEIGGMWEALDYLEKQIGEPVSICWQ
ncbi:S49 family peptidase [Candidatus Kaiserbacteria bacterium]|nr:S49 family peptidase [Candidatus Kaiserbacteria bacterium]